MEPATYNFTVYQGSTFDRTFTWFQPDGVTPVNLTGCTARMQGRSAGHTRPSPTGDPLFELATAPGTGIILGDAAGTVRVIIADDLSSAWTFKGCEHDLEVYFPDGTTQRLFQGHLDLNYEVTK
jgi:hypothetical protein